MAGNAHGGWLSRVVRIGVGAVVLALSWTATFGASPAGAEPVTTYRCLGSVGGRALDGPSNVGLPGTWHQGDPSSSYLISCTYPDPTFVSEWNYQLAWTPPGGENMLEGCASKPYSPDRVFVSPDHWAYVSTNIVPPAPLEAAARGQLATIESRAKPCAAATTTTTVAETTTPVPAFASVTDVVGDATIMSAGSTEYIPLTGGMAVQVGDSISTDIDASVTISLPGGTVTIEELSQVRVNRMFLARDLTKLQLLLRSGRMMTTIPEQNLLRTDFTTTTPMATAAIRGSEMIVAVDVDGVTTVRTTEDVAYVQGTADAAPIVVSEGEMSTVGADGRASAPVPFSGERAASEPAQSGGSSSPLVWIVSALVLVGIAAAVVVIVRQRVQLR